MNTIIEQRRRDGGQDAPATSALAHRYVFDGGYVAPMRTEAETLVRDTGWLQRRVEQVAKLAERVDHHVEADRAWFGRILPLEVMVVRSSRRSFRLLWLAELVVVDYTNLPAAAERRAAL